MWEFEFLGIVIDGQITANLVIDSGFVCETQDEVGMVTCDI